MKIPKRFQRYRSSLRANWISAIAIVLAIIAFIIGLVFIRDAWYFGYERAFHFSEIARNSNNVSKKESFRFAAAGSWGLATTFSAAATACFSFASILISTVALLRSTIWNQQESTDEEDEQMVRENHDLSEYVE